MTFYRVLTTIMMEYEIFSCFTLIDSGLFSTTVPKCGLKHGDAVPYLFVGAGGGCEDGRGPCACPRYHTIRWDGATQTNRTPTRTGTRPPHPLHPSPCPYRTRMFHSPIRSANIIKNVPGCGGQEGSPVVTLSAAKGLTSRIPVS